MLKKYFMDLKCIIYSNSKKLDETLYKTNTLNDSNEHGLPIWNFWFIWKSDIFYSEK